MDKQKLCKQNRCRALHSRTQSGAKLYNVTWYEVRERKAAQITRTRKGSMEEVKRALDCKDKVSHLFLPSWLQMLHASLGRMGVLKHVISLVHVFVYVNAS